MADDLTARLEETTRHILQEMARQFEEARQDTARQFEEARQDTARQFEEARQDTARQFEEARQETLERFERVDQRFEKVDDQIRQTRVLIEDVQSDLRAVAEGVAMVNEKMDRMDTKYASEIRDVQAEVRFAHRRSEQRNDEQDARLDALEAAEG